MNKKFLLLPLTAMTASVYAVEAENHDQIDATEIPGQYTKALIYTINNNETTNFTSEDSGMIDKKYLSESGDDISILYIYKTIKGATEANAKFDDVFSVLDADSYAKLEEKLQKIDQKQQLKFATGDEFKDIIFLNDQEIQLTYAELCQLQPDETTRGVDLNTFIQTFNDEVLKALNNKGIKQTEKFIAAKGTTKLEIPNSTQTAKLETTIEQVIAKIITEDDKKTYGTPTKIFTRKQLKNDVRIFPDKKYKTPIPVDDSGAPIKTSPEYLQAMSAIDKREAEVNKHIPNQSPAQEKLGKATDPVQDQIALLIPTKEGAMTISRDPLIAATETCYKACNPTSKKTFINKLKQNAPTLYQGIQETIQTSDGQPVPQISKQDQIALKITNTSGTAPIVDILYDQANFKFGHDVKPAKIALFTKLYTDIAQKLAQADPTKWKQADYLKAIAELINQKSIKQYGLEYKDGKNLQDLIKDLNNFNQYQKTKYVYCYFSTKIN